MSAGSMSSRIKTLLSSWITRSWYRPDLQAGLLPFVPLAALVASEARRRLKRFRRSPPWKPPVPVIVVGNITVGGTGKTPLVAAMVRRLKENGYCPGIISRGYGADAGTAPRLVTRLDSPAECGDEPVMLADLTGVPVVVDSDRSRAVRFLLEHTECDLVISDDGLQHFRLHRDLEIVVIDGQRGLGNGYCLPAGPLREPASRLKSVDFVVCNGGQAVELDTPSIPMTLQNSCFVSVTGGEPRRPLDWNWQDRSVHGVAGIGNPDRFFTSLEELGFAVERHAFVDHHAYRAEDLSFPDQRDVIMTGKDAIKCREFARQNWWYLAVEASLPDTFWDLLMRRLCSVNLCSVK